MAAEMTRNIPESEIFVLLSRRRRRQALRALRRASAPLTVEELTEDIGQREYECPSADQLRTILITLSHNHLPRLDEADVVRYDRDDGTVYPGPNFDALVSVLEGVTDRDEPWSGD